MNEHDLLNAMSDIDPSYIQEAEDMAGEESHKDKATSKNNKAKVYRILATALPIAACVALVIGVTTRFDLSVDHTGMQSASEPSAQMSEAAEDSYAAEVGEEVGAAEEACEEETAEEAYVAEAAEEACEEAAVEAPAAPEEMAEPVEAMPDMEVEESAASPAVVTEEAAEEAVAQEANEGSESASTENEAAKSAAQSIKKGDLSIISAIYRNGTVTLRMTKNTHGKITIPFKLLQKHDKLGWELYHMPDDYTAEISIEDSDDKIVVTEVDLSELSLDEGYYKIVTDSFEGEFLVKR